MLNISFFQEKNQLKSKSTLPVPLTPLIGRQEDVIALSALLQENRARLLTLWGAGGVGKTRLALEAVAQIVDYFPDGVFFIDLAAIREPARILPAIAAALGAKNSTEPTMQEHLQAYLHGKELLLLLDNFEQLLPAAAVLTDLLLANGGLKILVTSRALLNVRGERGFHVLPLALPESSLQEDLTCIMQFAAIQLFVRRAQEVNAHFQMTASNASAVAEVCRRLDGLPLAIELAAAHTKLLSAQQLLKLLQNRLQLLTNGARDLTARQQTLRNTLKWSYDLLTPEEQRIFRQCSIFESTYTLEALEAITGETTVTLLERVTALLDKSLLHQSRSANGEPSLRMLDTVREYSREQLLAHEEFELVQHTYINYYQELALEAEQKLTGPEQGLWLDRLQVEYENLQAVLRLLVERGEEESTRALGRVLYLCGYIRGGGRASEEFSWLERVISCGTQTRLAARARALHCLGASAFFAEGDNHYGEHSTQAPSRRADQLTAREKEILRLVATGITDAQIAQQLIISPRTVSWHLSSIYAKIGVSSRSAATCYAIKQHLCSP
ncbi:MAG TPA: LuxR C-terminal-related transcriptional regulator [Ktedonosporobacter sp.]|jgi:predicted ATPase/DNA-binding CsgD family transcriptional regulator|nr:LuxR C-terminal-related transcriptional regulator [Ktedonosporobacter sp.]